MVRQLLFTLGILLSTFFVDGATLSGIQKGTTVLNTGSTLVNQAITSVTLANSFLVYSIRVDSDRPDGFQVSGRMSATNQLTFSRDVGGGNPVTIEWQVFTFSSGVFVQRGEVTNLPQTGTNVTITSVNLSRTFVLLNMNKDGGQYGSDDGINGDLTSSTNLFIDRENGGANPQNVYWQVIEWTGASVQKVIATMNAGVDSLAVTLGTSVTKSKTMVVGEHQVSTDINASDLPATELLNGTTLLFTRVTTTGTMSFICYVVSFTDNTDVVHGVIRMTSIQDNISTTICSVTAASSGIINGSNYNRVGGNCRSADDNMGFSWATMVLTNSTTVTASRNRTGSALRIPFQVLEFTAAVPSGCGNTEPGFSTPRKNTTGYDLCSAALPVEVYGFTIKPSVENYALVIWSTATEVNNNKFNVQRSLTGEIWEDIGTIKGKGNSSVNLNYRFVDEAPHLGLSFYRLQQVDFDGTISYSEIKSYEQKVQLKSGLIAYPNPTKGFIKIVGNNIDDDEFYLVNVHGKCVKLLVVEKKHNEITLDLTNLEPGCYFLETENGSMKLIKN